MNSARQLDPPIPARETQDGDGVRIKRSLGPAGMGSLDPFLMLDELKADAADAADVAGGFPPHPHRGFETVTYMLEGGFRHEDHMGNRGEITAGGVQWMTAGRGVIHSEMPLQDGGPLHGFQLWLNLPAAEKMRPAAWQDIPASAIPRVSLQNGGEMRLIAGTVDVDGRPVQGAVTDRSTQPTYLDVRLPAAGGHTFTVPEGHAGFLYVYRGELAGPSDGPLVSAQQLARFGAGDRLSLRAGPQGAGFLLLHGRPLGEPVVQYGPFVMNSRAEIEQALRDYRDGHLTD